MPTKAKASSKADWRAETLDRIRALIREADPAMIEECKWRKPSNMPGVPVFGYFGRSSRVPDRL
jgi:hypothetical protein